LVFVRSSLPAKGRMVARKEGDWYCLECRNLNFAFRQECRHCDAARTFTAEEESPENMMDAEAWLDGHDIDEDKMQQFLELSEDKQQMIILKGPLKGCRDPTAVLVSRLNALPLDRSQSEGPRGEFEGKVKSYSVFKGVGFILPDVEGEPDIFLHLRSIVDGSTPSAGDTLTFDLEPAEKGSEGQMKALNVRGGSGYPLTEEQKGKDKGKGKGKDGKDSRRPLGRDDGPHGRGQDDHFGGGRDAPYGGGGRDDPYGKGFGGGGKLGPASMHDFGGYGKGFDGGMGWDSGKGCYGGKGMGPYDGGKGCYDPYDGGKGMYKGGYGGGYGDPYAGKGWDMGKGGHPGGYPGGYPGGCPGGWDAGKGWDMGKGKEWDMGRGGCCGGKGFDDMGKGGGYGGKDYGDKGKGGRLGPRGHESHDRGYDEKGKGGCYGGKGHERHDRDDDMGSGGCYGHHVI